MDTMGTLEPWDRLDTLWTLLIHWDRPTMGPFGQARATMDTMGRTRRYIETGYRPTMDTMCPF